MIADAVRAARGTGDPPPMLALAWLCGDKHLPDAGGMLDQDAATIRQMNALNSVYYTVKNIHRYQGEKMKQMPESMKDVAKMLTENGLWWPDRDNG